MSYGDVALGVECALPAVYSMVRRRSRARRVMAWLIAVLARRT